MNVSIFSPALVLGLLGLPAAPDESGAERAAGGAPAHRQEAVPAGGVQVGQAAPALAIEAWVHGSPVAELALGQVHALAFVSPWSEDCSPALPTLAHLQSERGPSGFQVVAVTGTDARGTAPGDLERRIAALGELVRFPVGFDAGEATRRAWLGPRHADVLPRVVLVDQRGKVAFIGEPEWLARPLERVLADEWDPESGSADIERAKSTFLELRTRARRDPVDALGSFEAFAGEFPEYAFHCGPVRFAAMLDAAGQGSGSLEQAFAFGSERVLEAIQRSDYLALDRIAFAIVDPDRGLAEPDLELAKRAASQAERVTGGRNAVVLDTLSRVHTARGDHELAAVVASRAVDVAPDSLRDELAERLRACRERRDAAEAEEQRAEGVSGRLLPPEPARTTTKNGGG